MNGCALCEPKSRSPIWQAVVLIMAVVMTVTVSARQARACRAVESAYQIGADDSDLAAPTRPTVLSLEVIRGLGPEKFVSSASCDDLGTILLGLTAKDDVTPPDELGYRFRIVDGTPPLNFGIPDLFVQQQNGLVSLFWADGSTSDQDAFDFVLGIRAVDRAGHVGPETQLRVRHPGGNPVDKADSGGTGCALLGHREVSWSVVPLLLAALGFLRRRTVR